MSERGLELTEHFGDQLCTIDKFCSESECQEWIKITNKKGWQESCPTGGGNGRTGREDPRTNCFCVVYDQSFADKLWNRIAPLLPPDLSNIPPNPYLNSQTKGTEWKPVGVVEKLRFYRYDIGQEFPEHVDYKSGRDIVREENGEQMRYRQQSFFTLLVYLNDDFTGGTTNYWTDHEGIHCRFLRDVEVKEPSHKIKAQTGRAVLQEQNILHEGSPPTKGMKYILRTDIIHEKFRPQHPKLINTTKHLKPVTQEWERIFEASCKNYAE